MEKKTKEFLKTVLPVAMILSTSWNVSANLASIKTDEPSIRKDIESTAPEFVEMNEKDIYLTYGCNGSCQALCQSNCTSACGGTCSGHCSGGCQGSCKAGCFARSFYK